jgi:hypothetical protein
MGKWRRAVKSVDVRALRNIKSAPLRTGALSVHSTGLAISQPFIFDVDCSPVISSVGQLGYFNEVK